jgi:hypothetical protein
MVGTVKPSRWAVEQFGDDAFDVAKCVVKGLMHGQRGARTVQAVARAEGATSNYAYGSFWNTRYQVVVDQFKLADLPNYEMVRPPGASYWLAVVNGRVLIPFRHDTTMNKPIGQAKVGSLIPRRIARDHGVLPERTLFDEPDGAIDVEGATESPTVGEVAADAAALNLTVVYIAYVANADSDEIQAAWWGTPISLEDNGTMVWVPEQLDLSIAADTATGATDAGLRPVGTAGDTPGFAQGDEPNLDFSPKTRTDELPASEPESSIPDATAADDE